MTRDERQAGICELRERLGRDPASLAQVEKALHRDRRTLFADKDFPVFKSGKRYLVSAERLYDWINQPRRRRVF